MGTLTTLDCFFNIGRFANQGGIANQGGRLGRVYRCGIYISTLKTQWPKNECGRWLSGFLQGVKEIWFWRKLQKPKIQLPYFHTLSLLKCLLWEYTPQNQTQCGSVLCRVHEVKLQVPPINGRSAQVGERLRCRAWNFMDPKHMGVSEHGVYSITVKDKDDGDYSFWVSGNL